MIVRTKQSSQTVWTLSVRWPEAILPYKLSRISSDKELAQSIAYRKKIKGNKTYDSKSLKG